MNYCDPLLYLSLASQFPHLYFALVLFFLIPLSSFIFFQLFRLVNLEICFYVIGNKNRAACTTDELLSLLSILVKKKLWLDSIKLIESRLIINDVYMYQYLNALGFTYYNMQKYDLAKFYYIEALKIKQDYILALQNLAKVYEVLRDNTLLKLTYESILKHDPVNKVASRQLSNLTQLLLCLIIYSG